MSDHKYNPKYTTMGIALAGVYATFTNEYSDMAGSATIYDSRLIPHLGDLKDGGVVIDKRSVRDGLLIKYVCSGPMLKESLPINSKSSFGSGIEHCDDAIHCKGFDFVSLDLYKALWESLGAKIGYRNGDRILWNDNSVTIIPPEEYRYKHPDGRIRSKEDEFTFVSLRKSA